MKTEARYTWNLIKSRSGLKAISLRLRDNEIVRLVNAANAANG